MLEMCLSVYAGIFAPKTLGAQRDLVELPPERSEDRLIRTEAMNCQEAVVAFSKELCPTTLLVGCG